MTEMSPRLKDALSRVEVDWNDHRTELAHRGMVRKRRRRAVTRVAVAGAGVAAAALLVVRLVGSGGAVETTVAETDELPVSAPAAVLAPEQPGDIVLHDGISVTPDADAEVDVVRSPDRVALQVVRGKSRFVVAPDADDESVDIAAGALTITVFSSEFSVARYADVSEVWSHRGRMEVVWQGETVILDAGDHRRFEPAPTGANPVEQPQASNREPRPKKRSDWRPLAREGRYEAAYQLLRVAPSPRPVADLMLAADVFRLSGHPRSATRPLRKVVTNHRDDPRAPLAAFTLGRILLDDLGRPADAARAFAKTRSFAPAGPLAEDALAREVEAWAKAGQASRARDRAELYLETYPRGHRARAVRHYGGL